MRRPSVRTLLVVSCYAGLIAGGALFGDWIAGALDLDLWPHTEPTVHRTIMFALAAYTIAMALPFVPGVEIGLALIAVFGARVVPVVYCTTVVALVAAFTVGRLIPAASLVPGLRSLGLARAARYVEDTSLLDLPGRRAHVEAALPVRLRPWLLRYPAVLLVALFNLPGNALLGGGGGIALALGASRLVSWPGYLLGVSLAVAPVPVAVLLGSKLSAF
jgi:hypothetical protein